MVSLKNETDYRHGERALAFSTLLSWLLRLADYAEGPERACGAALRAELHGPRRLHSTWLQCAIVLCAPRHDTRAEMH